MLPLKRCQAFGPSTLSDGVGDGCVTGCSKIFGHLNCQYPAGFYRFHQSGEQLFVVIQPVQRGIGVNNICSALWLPVIKVGVLPEHPGLHVLSEFQHAGG